MRNIAVGVIISIGLIVSTLSYCFLTRYQISATDKFTYKIDRMTGKTWVCFPIFDKEKYDCTLLSSEK